MQLVTMAPYQVVAESENEFGKCDQGGAAVRLHSQVSGLLTIRCPTLENDKMHPNSIINRIFCL